MYTLVKHIRQEYICLSNTCICWCQRNICCVSRRCAPIKKRFSPITMRMRMAADGPMVHFIGFLSRFLVVIVCFQMFWLHSHDWHHRCGFQSNEFRLLVTRTTTCVFAECFIWLCTTEFYSTFRLTRDNSGGIVHREPHATAWKRQRTQFRSYFTWNWKRSS